MSGAAETLTCFAPAKLNLALHVTGRREDGYHLLDSLVCFVGSGDRLSLSLSPGETRLRVTGPFAAGVPTGPENLARRAADLFERRDALDIELEKNLPHPAGIGGGSSDAVAVLRMLGNDLGWEMPRADALLGLGADVPVCLRGVPTRMRGVGEILDDVPQLPPLWVVLANPRVAMPTGPVFDGLASRENAPMTEPAWHDTDRFLDWLAAQRNDLELPARAIAPVLDSVLTALGDLAGCRLARMSGSGATCFALFTEGRAAREAARQLSNDRPLWWVEAAPILGA